MRLFPIIVCSALALASVQSVMAGNQGPQGGSSQEVTQPSLPDAPLPVGLAGGQAKDKNGNPMTQDSYNKAADARMKDRIAATETRLENKQAKWKKAPKKGVGAKP